MKFIFKSNKNDNSYDLVAEYSVSYSDDNDGWLYIFKIYEESRIDCDSFDFMLKIMDNGTDLKVVAVYPDQKNYYLGRGISISIILKVKEIFERRIISSSNLKPTYIGESISDLAIEKVWSRLVDMGKAKYCFLLEHFYLL